jgi:hypothetical protein
MAYKQFLLKIDESLFEQFKKACDSKDMSEVMIKLIKKFIRDKEISDSFNRESEEKKKAIFAQYLNKIQK